ncbi:MAG: transporter substrate-binding domain-containing protein [Desulfobacteraceae bacterium]
MRNLSRAGVLGKLCLLALMSLLLSSPSWARDLDKVREDGVLRHLGIPYARFVTGSGDGLDVEMVRLFARHLGVEYRFVETDWGRVIGDLSGKDIQPEGDDVRMMGEVPVRGDIIATGLTVLPWREKVVSYSRPTFPTQVWLMARADSALKPIKPSGEIRQDIEAVKAQLHGLQVLGIEHTCVDPSIYGLDRAGATPGFFGGNLNDLVPALLNGEGDVVLVDVADALVALEKWPGLVKVIGPVSPIQNMAFAFSKAAPNLRAAFNRFFEESKKNGTYKELVKKYYDGILKYYPEFFK